VAYATVEQLDGVLGHTPSNAAVLLDRASRDIDRALKSAFYVPDDPDVLTALQEATLEQVAWQLESGNPSGIRHSDQPGVPSGPSAGGISLTRTGRTVGAASGPPWLGEQAWIILQTAQLTGHAPFTWLGG
jgi:hypothetical protein